MTRYIVKKVATDPRERDKVIYGCGTLISATNFILNSPYDTSVYVIDTETLGIIAHAKSQNGVWDICIGLDAG